MGCRELPLPPAEPARDPQEPRSLPRAGDAAAAGTDPARPVPQPGYRFPGEYPCSPRPAASGGRGPSPPGPRHRAPHSRQSPPAAGFGDPDCPCCSGWKLKTPSCSHSCTGSPPAPAAALGPHSHCPPARGTHALGLAPVAGTGFQRGAGRCRQSWHSSLRHAHGPEREVTQSSDEVLRDRLKKMR